MSVSVWDIVVPAVLVFMVLAMIYTNYALPSAQSLMLISYNLVAPILVTFLVSKHYGAIWTTRTMRKIQHSVIINPALKDWQLTLSSKLIGIGYRSGEWGSGVNYRKGKFIANGPFEPSDTFSSLVRDHLMSEYEQVWKKWSALKIESRRLNQALAEYLNRSVEGMSQSAPTVLTDTHGRLLEPDSSSVVKEILVAGLDNALDLGTNDIIVSNPQSDLFYVRWKDGNNIAQFPTPESSTEACRQLRLLLKRPSMDLALVELANQYKNTQARIEALRTNLKEISRDVDAGGVLGGECDVCRKF
jgi:hypothetical protein